MTNGIDLVVLKERFPRERRVAAVPDTAKRLRELGFNVVIEAGAGDAAGYPDRLYEAAGAAVAQDIGPALGGAAIVLCVRGPEAGGERNEIDRIRPGAVLVGMLAPYGARQRLQAYAAHGLTCFALELMPRITRAQAMDVLSSQANLAGYAAVIRGAAAFGRAFPMMVTAAGTIAPARVLVLGAGVAGLQAIATARRLGAIVSAMDVRPAVREQVESLGASFVEVSVPESGPAETEAGYAREMGERYRERQAEVLRETLKRSDLVITTALIPGRPAPRLIEADMVPAMRPGSVIVDMAVEQGGNCALSRADETVTEHGVSIIGDAHLPSEVATDASALYARNLVSFLGLLVDKPGALDIEKDDEIVRATRITHAGSVTREGEGG